ncbi:histidinol-phosphatase HisJ family protein [Limisphaera ngatamarikiensis]|uniref:Histidinol-phosphatase n=1 Tax=Limisphaera ngatamarikiensis TaxID=1324935 RepID=A0A6M1RSF6_9BACT|nr:histidinol-phosphatase HisJ family protein [Limisphaera ngatamarikiensis]NGO39545.1 histidinol-phosphatase HisJ family protein [Limisphaera ngatamarikiensis]
MEWPADYHMHTPLCRHARGEPVEYALRARALGLREIGFADHAPMPQDDFDDWRMRASELEAYVAAVEAARRAVPEVKIRLGLEVDYLPGLEGWIRELAGRHAWDFLIGSVHYVTEDWAIDHPGQVRRWEGVDPASVWQAYLERLEAAAGSGLFDILGHVDLPKKFGHRPPAELAPLWRRLFEVARRAGCAIEINTAGLRKPCGEMYPAPALLRMAFEAGVGLTFGSDAHAPEEVGSDWAEAVRLARAAGYRETLRWEGRRKVGVELPELPACPVRSQVVE